MNSPRATLLELAERFGTPFFVYDLDEISERVTALRAALPPAVEIAYAVKANPAPAVLVHVAGLGLGADVASGGELELVRRAGFDMGTVAFTGPGKRDEELEAAVCAGLRAVTVESLGELERLIGICRRLNRRVPVMLRAAGGTSRAMAEGPTKTIIGSGAGKFGMRRMDLEQAAERAATAPELNLVGIHAFEDSNVLDADRLLEHAADTVRLAAEVAKNADTRLRLVDIGGGLGIPYAKGEPELDVGRLAEGLRRLHARWQGHPAFEDLRLLIEPGRHLLGPAGRYVCRVIDVKASDEGTVAIVDGGIHHLLRPALAGQAQRVTVEPARERPAAVVPLTVAGPLCTGLDVFCVQQPLPLPVVGDLAVVHDAGAYGFTESMPLFLSHPTPAELVLEGGGASLERARREPVTPDPPVSAAGARALP